MGGCDGVGHVRLPQACLPMSLDSSAAGASLVVSTASAKAACCVLYASINEAARLLVLSSPTTPPILLPSGMCRSPAAESTNSLRNHATIAGRRCTRSDDVHADSSPSCGEPVGSDEVKMNRKVDSEVGPKRDNTSHTTPANQSSSSQHGVAVGTYLGSGATRRAVDTGATASVTRGTGTPVFSLCNTSHASSTRRRVRNSPNWRISLFFSPLKVSLGYSTPRTSAGSRI